MEPDAAAESSAPAIVNCEEWGSWHPTPAGEVPRSPTKAVACSFTCEEPDAARVTVWCEGPRGILGDCYCMAGTPGNPNGAFGYTTCWVGGIFDFQHVNGPEMCANDFRAFPMVMADCLNAARGPTCD